MRTPRISIFGSRAHSDKPPGLPDRGRLQPTHGRPRLARHHRRRRRDREGRPRGPGAESSFGLAIPCRSRRPPTRSSRATASSCFRYFFTRKLMFLEPVRRHRCLPGGFGTQDELLGSPTLIQTGKSAIVPVVLIEAPDRGTGPGGRVTSATSSSPPGSSARPTPRCTTGPPTRPTPLRTSPPSTRATTFARVGDDLVIRIREPLRPRHVGPAQLRVRVAGPPRRDRAVPAYVREEEHLDPPRIAFTHTRRDSGLVRRLIDRINDLASTRAPPAAPGSAASRRPSAGPQLALHRISTLRARPRSR